MKEQLRREGEYSLASENYKKRDVCEWRCFLLAWVSGVCALAYVVSCLQGQSQPRCSLISCCSIKAPGVISYKNRVRTGRRMAISLKCIKSLHSQTSRPQRDNVILYGIWMQQATKKRRKKRILIINQDWNEEKRMATCHSDWPVEEVPCVWEDMSLLLIMAGQFCPGYSSSIFSQATPYFSISISSSCAGTEC